MRYFYAGIGSRNAPSAILKLMTSMATRLEAEGAVLRSGNAEGSDRAFQGGVKDPCNMEVFLSRHGHQPWAMEEVKRCMPVDRSGFDNWKPYIKGLMARNMMQVLGCNGISPVSFVLCYAPSFEYHTSKPGGTGYAIRCALNHDIPVFNLFDENTRSKLQAHLAQELEFHKYIFDWTLFPRR